ncbi:MAG: prepilin-type N-terminal cleavage/methylation domain-containing protein [Candidatus Gracilibacteria bacterium]|nr:prepilin-type N-terminal cleavage/methylation domain-containing protein [Candidatus Gracilibacteria bacterium]
MKNNNLEYRMQNIGLKQKLLCPKFYQLPISKTTGFTLVELIVVIVILAILGTIAFISFQGYSRNSRDGVRIADINSVKKSLEIFITKAGFYPTPDNATNITYSGATVWIEGTLGSNVIKNIETVSKVITDPLTANEYTYSITSSKTEYQIGSISEGGGLTEKILTNKTYAADLSKSSAVAYISGNYNEKFTKVNTGTSSWILAQPSIISTDKITSTDLANILSNKKLAYNSYGNIPSSYNTPGTQSGGFNYTNGNPIIFTGTLEELHDNNQRKLDFLTNLKQAYTSTDLATNPMYQDIMSQDPTGDSTGAINLVISYINSNKGGIKLQELVLLPTSGTGTTGGGTTYECNGSLILANANITNTSGLTSNTNYQNTNSSGLCYYTCKTNYSGLNCDTFNDPSIATCTSFGQIITALTTYGACDTPDIIVCSGTGTGYTISACNLGTNTTGTGESSYGYYFQWGNNHGSLGNEETTSTLVDASAYGPGNYYSSTMFINGSSLYRNDWTTIQNDNLWGDTTNTNEARQGPCISGYHVPKLNEWIGLVSSGGWGNDGIAMSTALSLPLSGYRDWLDGTTQLLGGYATYWSSTPGGFFQMWPGLIGTGISDKKSYGVRIRCFKN